MAKLSQRIERGVKTTSSRGLKLNLSLKKLFSQRAHCVFITAIPKSGSTFLATVLSRCTGFIPFFLGYHHLNEQDLYLPKLIDSYSMDVVSHHHTRATQPNIKLMREFGIRPVILTRDIFDVIVSLRDHLENESRTTPVITVAEDFFQHPTELQHDFLIDLAVPWYINFYASWAQVSASRETDTLWIKYDEITSDRAGVVNRILDYYKIKCDQRSVEHAIISATVSNETRLNVGVSGRGKTSLTDLQKDRIRKLAVYYPEVDFSGLGFMARLAGEKLIVPNKAP